MTKIFHILSCVAMLLTAACTTSADIREQIAKAEQMASEHPAEAIAIMEAIDRDEVRGDHDRARYALVLSEAHYYNRTGIDRDTLTTTLWEYYRFSDKDEERARALYQHALALHAEGRNSEAMLALMETEESLSKINNKRLEGLIYRTRGDIYGSDCLYRNAYDAYAIARKCFDEAQLDEHSAYTIYDMASTELLMRHYAEAEALLREVQEYATVAENNYLLCQTLIDLAELYSQIDDYESCAATLRFMDDSECLLFDFCHFFSLKAICEAHFGHRDEAMRSIADAKLSDDYDESMVNYTLYVVHRSLGDSAEALMWHEWNKHEQDALILEVLEQPVLNVEVDSLQRNLESEKRERALIRQRNTLLMVGAIIIVVGAILYIWYRMRKKNLDIAQYIATIEELQHANRNLPEEMTASVSALYIDRFSELNHLCDIYYDHSGSSRQKNLVFDKLTETIDSIKNDQKRLRSLEEAVNRYRDNIMQRLREQLPRLTERDERIALYTFAGFSNRAISIFLDSDPVSVSRYRYNLKQKIKNSECDDREMLLSALSDK